MALLDWLMYVLWTLLISFWGVQAVLRYGDWVASCVKVNPVKPPPQYAGAGQEFGGWRSEHDWAEWVPRNELGKAIEDYRSMKAERDEAMAELSKADGRVNTLTNRVNHLETAIRDAANIQYPAGATSEERADLALAHLRGNSKALFCTCGITSVCQIPAHRRTNSTGPGF